MQSRTKRIQSQKTILLPKIKSQENEQINEIKKKRKFNLQGMYNVKLPEYNAEKDKSLKLFFEKPGVKKMVERKLGDDEYNGKNSSMKMYVNNKGDDNWHLQKNIVKNSRQIGKDNSKKKIGNHRNSTQGTQLHPYKEVSKQDFLKYLQEIRSKISTESTL